VNVSFVIGVSLGVLASLLLNLGKGVQKLKLADLLAGPGFFKRESRRDLLGWFIGLLMSFGASFPYAFGLKLSHSPSAMSSVSGVGLIGLAIFAVRVIGEPLGRRDLVGMALVVLATSAIGYLGALRPEVANSATDAGVLLAAGAVTLPMALLCLASLRYRAIWGVAFGSAAGASIGMALFLFDAALQRTNGTFSGLVWTPFSYLALVPGTAATVLTQFGFARAPALVVVPAVSCSTILAPWLLEAVAYGTRPDLPTVGLLAMALAGVVCLSTGAAARAA